jgi:hypothetical protein
VKRFTTDCELERRWRYSPGIFIGENMDAFIFGSLCRDACQALGIADQDALAEMGQINIDGVDVGLVFDEEDPSRLFCYVDLGDSSELATAPDPVSIYKDMLSLNLLKGSKIDGVIGWDPSSDRFVLAAHLIDPDSLDGVSLSEILRHHARHAGFARNVRRLHLQEELPPERSSIQPTNPIYTANH